MPWIRVAHPRGQRAAGQEETGGSEWSGKPMGEEREAGEEAAAGNQQQWSLLQALTEGRSKDELWSQTLRTFCCFAPVAAVWFFCQLEALPHPSWLQEDVCCRLLLVCLLWALLAGGGYALRRCLRPGQNREEPQQRTQQGVEPESCRNLYSCQLSRRPPTGTPDVEAPLALALTDGLLLCVLQEPLQDPTVSHIEALHSRLEAVARTLERVHSAPEAIPEGVDRGSALEHKLKLLCAYLEQRTGSLQALVQVQADFESSVQELLRGLDGLWTRLEELHAGVTLTKQDSQGNRDPASAQADAESLDSMLDQYQTKLQSCQAHLKDSTQLLQELTWSHSHTSSKVDSANESVWPELLLQSNIEQFDKVQENFTSLEQQTATFKTHLQGLGKKRVEAVVGPLPRANGAVPDPQSSPDAMDLPLRSSTPLGKTRLSPLSLRERSALKFSSTMGCLHKPGRKK